MADDRVKIMTTNKSSILHITNAREADTGIYTLEINNHLGFNQLSSSVTVEGKFIHLFGKMFCIIPVLQSRNKIEYVYISPTHTPVRVFT